MKLTLLIAVILCLPFTLLAQYDRKSDGDLSAEISLGQTNIKGTSQGFSMGYYVTNKAQVSVKVFNEFGRIGDNAWRNFGSNLQVSYMVAHIKDFVEINALAAGQYSKSQINSSLYKTEAGVSAIYGGSVVFNINDWVSANVQIERSVNQTNHFVPNKGNISIGMRGYFKKY